MLFLRDILSTAEVQLVLDSVTHTLAAMGRLHSKGKGISASAIPYSRAVPTWFKSTPDTVVDNICKLARKGATPSQIGVVLRDSHGVAQVKVVTGNKILRILKSNGMRHSGFPAR